MSGGGGSPAVLWVGFPADALGIRMAEGVADQSVVSSWILFWFVRSGGKAADLLICRSSSLSIQEAARGICDRVKLRPLAFVVCNQTAGNYPNY